MAKVCFELILSQVISEMTVRVLLSSQYSALIDKARKKGMNTQTIANKVLLSIYNNVVNDVRANLYNPCYSFTMGTFSRVEMNKYQIPAPYIVVKYSDSLGKSGLEFMTFDNLEDFKAYVLSKESYLNDSQILLSNGYLMVDTVLSDLGILDSINPHITTKSTPNQNIMDYFNLIDYFNSIHIFWEEPRELSTPSYFSKPFKRSRLSEAL